MTDEFLELGGSLGVLSRSQVSLCTDKEPLIPPCSYLCDWSEQIHGLNGVSSFALDDRPNERQMDPLVQCVLRTQPIQFRCQRFSLRHVAGSANALAQNAQSPKLVSLLRALQAWRQSLRAKA